MLDSKNIMEVNNRDLRLIALGCFRYSLGRKTYMPQVTTEFIMANKEIFRKHDWKSFIEEIKSCDDLGMDCDATTWLKFSVFCLEIVNENNKS